MANLQKTYKVEGGTIDDLFSEKLIVHKDESGAPYVESVVFVDGEEMPVVCRASIPAGVYNALKVQAVNALKPVLKDKLKV